jgi:hypothetical protein
MQNNTGSLSVIDTSWEPVMPSESKSLASAITNKDFRKNLINMLKEYDTIPPDGFDSYGNEYIRLSEKYRVLENNFDFGTFQIRTQTMNNEQSMVPFCYATLYVLTELGYEPWFSRMGVGDPNMVSTDGLHADAETTARRRILVALGLGKDGSNEVVNTDQDNMRKHLGATILEKGMTLSGLVMLYTGKAQVNKLPPLNLTQDKLKAYKEDSDEAVVGYLIDSDVSSLHSFIKTVKS